MRVLLPNELEAGAVVPQCLDNQYVTAEALAALIDKSLTYADHPIHELRTRVIRNEFMRSLVYAPQVIVNRAYFKNNSFLYDHYHPRNASGLISFAELMKEGAILPFLGHESSLTDRVKFDTTSDGEVACEALADRVADDYGAVKFSKDEVENGRHLQQLSRRFADYFAGLQTIDYVSRMEMASELFSDQELLRDESVVDGFHDLIDDLARYAWEHGSAYQKAERQRAKDPNLPAPSPLSRNDIYKRFFMVDDPAQGRFVRAHGSEREARFAVKKLVDLRYNTNLPDLLGRYTFTPLDMPSRMALQDELVQGDSIDDVDHIISAAEQANRAIIADYQEEMYLPLLEDLSLADVIKIRQLPEWSRFMHAQATILNDPLGQCGQLHVLNRRFTELQIQIGKWYRDQYPIKDTHSRYKVAVTLLLSIGAANISVGLDDWKAIDAILSGDAPFVVPERTKGIMAKLAFYVIDVTAARIDNSRSWTLQISRSNETFDRDYFLGCLKRLRQTDQGTVRRPRNLADQGKQ